MLPVAAAGILSVAIFVVARALQFDDTIPSPHMLILCY
jgi:hypothetical protein